MFVNYRYAMAGETLPPVGNVLFEYVVGSNGLFVRAARLGMAAMIPVEMFRKPLKGLAELNPYVDLYVPKVPALLLSQIVLEAWAAKGMEKLFYLLPFPEWRLSVPEQVQGAVSVRPVDPFNEAMRECLVEVHSHHCMPPYFSATDDKDETGFRIYGVVGNLGNMPSLAVRVGIYGHTWAIPGNFVFNLYFGVQDEFYATETEAIC